MRQLHVVLAGLACAILAVPVWAAIPKAADVPPLVKQLSDKDPKVRANAIKELGHIGSVKKSLIKDAIPAMVQATKDSDVNVKVEAYSALGRAGVEPEKVVPVLIEGLKSDNQKLVIGAAQALGYYGGSAEEAIPTLRKVAQDNEVPRNNKEAEAKFKRDELNKRRAIGRAVGDAMRAIGGSKK